MADKIPLLADLRRVQIKASGEMMAALERARKNVAAKAREASASDVASERFRRAFYRKVDGIYDLLDQELTDILKDASVDTVNLTREAAVTKIRKVANTKKAKGMAVKFDPERMRRYIEFIQPENGPSLAAVFTQKMSQEDREILRVAVLKGIRQGELEGLTANQRHKAIQSAWDEAAGNLDGVRFIDSAGREWKNARYLQMLVRTTQSRLSRESYIDTVVEHGDDLMRIVPAGDNCKACQAWAGIIVSVTGNDERFPSYEDAIESGVYHPNCDCSLERVDETVDAEDSAAQANAKTPDDPSDLDAMQAYRDEIGLEEPEGRDGPVDFTDETAKAYQRARKKGA